MTVTYEMWADQDPDAVSPGELGHVTFEEWYQTPVFEPELGERLEAAATLGRAPTRLVASLLLRVQANRSAPRPAHLRRHPIAAFLDGWAEREARSQALLESWLVPRRWRA